MHAVRVIRFDRRWPEPKVIVQFGRHGLWNQICLAAPLALLPIKAGFSAERDLQRPAEDTGLHQLFYRLHRSAHAVEWAVESKPGVQPENPLVFGDGRFYRLTFP